MKWAHLKNLMEKIIALLAIGLFSPFVLLISLMILLEEGRPVFFIQKRLGRYRKPFLIYKFRTMNAKGVTRMGKWLRLTGLDEIPQFINVFKGEMTFIGPRPLTEEDIKRFGWHRSQYDSRWNIPPGITGLAQLFGGRSARQSWLLDVLYLKRKSAILDMKLVFLSFLVNIFGKRIIRKTLKGGMGR